MARMSLLEITQDILSDMNSDEVNSIYDTPESLQVAQIVQTTYFNIIDGKEWPWLKELFQLTSLADPSKPTHMQIPENIINVEFVKYNTKKTTDTRDFVHNLTYKNPTDFLSLLEKRSSAESTIQVVTEPGLTKLNIQNNKAPQFWTSFDDNYIVFDSFDNTIDSVVQTSKTQCFGKRYPTFTFTGSFVPDLPVQMFSYLLNEAKSTCFLTLKETGNQKAEQHSITQRRRMSQEAWKTAKGITYPDFGRKGIK